MALWEGLTRGLPKSSPYPPTPPPPPPLYTLLMQTAISLLLGCQCWFCRDQRPRQDECVQVSQFETYRSGIRVELGASTLVFLIQK